MAISGNKINQSITSRKNPALQTINSFLEMEKNEK